MKADTTDPSSDSDRDDLPPRTIFRLLAEDRRRWVMQYLANRVGAVAISDVAEQIALREDDLTRDGFERILTGLYHVHLPTLGAAGVVEFDLARELVERRASAGHLTPYLELAADTDRR